MQAKVDYARNLLTSYKDVDEDDGGEDEAPEVPAAATGGRKRAKTVTFTEPDESDDDVSVRAQQLTSCRSGTLEDF